MAYRVEIGPKADIQLSELDPAIGSAVERKIKWLAENAGVMIHRRLVGMPDDLAGLCKLRTGDWRILYWIITQTERCASIESSTALRSVSRYLMLIARCI